MSVQTMTVNDGLVLLYLALVRVLELLPVQRRDATDLAVEVIVLRHEVAVLRRHVIRPALRPADRAPLAGLNRLWSRTKRTLVLRSARDVAALAPGLGAAALDLFN